MYNLVIPLLSPLWIAMMIANGTFIIGILFIGNRLSLTSKLKFADLLSSLIFFLLFFSQLYFHAKGVWSLDVLPFEFCSFMALFSGIALYTRSHLFYEITLYMGILFPALAFIFPAIRFGSDHVIFFSYFLSHCLTVIAPIYLTWVLGMRPRLFSWYKSLMPTAVVIPALMTTNLAFGTNYMFLASKPIVGKVLALGNWPFYIFVWIGAILLVSFSISCCLKKHPR